MNNLILKSLLIIMLISLVSCSKEESNELVDSVWENDVVGVKFEFLDDNVCKCSYLNNPNNNVLYGYTYNHPDITMYASSCTGFANLKGRFNENTLTLNLLDEDEVTITPISKEEIFYKK